MNKKLILKCFVLLFMLFSLVGCLGEEPVSPDPVVINAPTGLKIENGNLFFEGNENANSYICMVTFNGEAKTYNVQSGDSIDKFEFGNGVYELQVKAVAADGTESGWSVAIQYNNTKVDDGGNTEDTKLSAPTNVEISNNKLYWQSVSGADEYIVIFVKADGTVSDMKLNSGVLLTKLGLASGDYQIYVVANLSTDATKASDRSVAVSYTVEVKRISVPTGLAIEDDYLFFDAMGVTNNYVVKFVSGDTVIEREVSAGGADIGELVIPEGEYQVSIKAKGDGIEYADSEYSESIAYTKVEKFMVLAEKDLINAGYVKWMGRTNYNETTKANEVYHSASGFEVFFKGTKVIATITATKYNNADMRPCIVIVVDDDFDHIKTIFLDKETQEVELVADNDDINEHKVDLYKRCESLNSHIAIKEIKTDGVFIKKIVNKELKLEFIAASSSTGYGNLGNSSSGKQTTSNTDALKAFAFLTAQALDADVNIFSASGWGCYASKWTDPVTLNVPDAYDYVDFKSTIPWIYEKYVPDVVVVNLGTNDYSYIKGFSGAEYDAQMTAFQQKYISFLRHLHEIYPNAQIIVLYGLMNESDIYDVTEGIVEIAKADIPDLAVIKINGDALGYNSHPSVASHIIIARKLTAFIQGLLENK